ncbi:MAG TPA: tripartite tricarboxylate transporter substrate binding protein [Xanthobacteraceae bacterium]|nr:tripartite tricarboxylate transporter substrate binding protein [Xanthobacteraceae bacterium]
MGISSRILLALGLLLTAAASAAAQNYPARPLNMIVPFPPGGNTDIMGRALQNELGKALGQTIVIVNKGGAAGVIGINELVKAQPDGYTIALTPNNPLTAQPHLQKLSYGLDSFRYICLTYYAPYVLIAGPQAPFKTFSEFVTFAKAKSENLVYGHPGVASQPQLGMLAVLKAIGADALGVPFQGAGPMSHALLSGTVMAITETPSVARASNLPILAALAEERIAALPDVPTMRELGFPAESFTAGGLIAPASTPDNVVAVLDKACAQATAAEDYKAIVERLNATPRYLPGAAFRKMFDEDSIRSADAIQRAGLAGNR